MREPELNVLLMSQHVYYGYCCCITALVKQIVLKVLHQKYWLLSSLQTKQVWTKTLWSYSDQTSSTQYLTKVRYFTVSKLPQFLFYSKI